MRKQIVTTIKRVLRDISSKSIQNRLGYPENSKLLIIHADDFGLTNSENSATIEAMEKGIVNSCSIMVPCRGFIEAAEYAKSHPDADIGIHLTLTNEWDSYKWGPVLSFSEVKSLVDENGYFFKNKQELINNYKTEEVEKELRAQIVIAKKSGIDLTHIDSHMFITTTNEEILNVCNKLGKEYKLPVLLTEELPIRYLIRKDLIPVNYLLYARPEDSDDLIGYYRKAIKSLRPGLSCMLVHIAFDNKEMQGITGDQPAFGSAWRQADFVFFTSDECRQLIAENNIQLITWREIRDKLIRK